MTTSDRDPLDYDDSTVFSENWPYTEQPVYREAGRVRKLCAYLFGFGIGVLLISIALQVKW